MRTRPERMVVAWCALLCLSLGCASAVEAPEASLEGPAVVQRARPAHHEISLSLKGPGVLEIRDEIHFAAPSREFTFWLADQAHVTGVELDGAPWSAELESAPDTRFAESQRLTLTPERPASVLSVRYELRGAHEPDEALPTAHAMALIVHQDGIFLTAQRAWYARFEGARPSVSVESRLPEGMEPIAEGARIELPGVEGFNTTRFESESPSEGLTFIAAPRVRREARVEETLVRTLLSPENAAHAERYVEHLQRILPPTVSRLGPYPFPSFTIVEFPTRTLMAYPGYTIAHPSWIAQPSRWSSTLEHELLHAWWGHLVFLGPGGNWIEGLVTYLAEHEERARRSARQARRFRKTLLRNYRVYAAGEGEVSVSSFRSRHGHADQSIGYAKSAMLFHMLRRHLGEVAFFQGLRDITSRYRFAPATWDELLAAFEQRSDQQLGRFAVEWIERSGAPSLSLSAAYDEGPVGVDAEHAPHRLVLEIHQASPHYTLLVPAAITLATGVVYNADLPLEPQAVQRVELDVPARPASVRLDPDYDTFRLLNHDELEATLSELVGAPSPQLVIPSGMEEALVQSIELALAAELGGRFELRELTEADPERGWLQVTPSPSRLPPPLSVDPRGRLALDGVFLPEDATIVYALPHGEDTPPRVHLVPRSPSDAFLALTHLSTLASWSYVALRDGKLIARGMWPISQESVTAEVIRGEAPSGER